MIPEAQALAALGYPVFPCNGRAPRRGCKWQQEATTDPGKVDIRPGENIGIAVPLGTVVIDLDRKNGKDGVQALAGIVPAGWFYEGPRAHTGGGELGGFHFWFRCSPFLQLGNSSGDLPDGIDVRGGGKGYVVAPPSIHPDTGRVYVWLSPMVAPSELPELPTWLLDRLLAEKMPPAPAPLAASFPEATTPPPDAYLSKALESAVDRVGGAPKGERNKTLNQEAYDLAGLAGHGLDLGMAEEHLYTAATGAGLSAKETRGTIRSAFRAGSQRLRDIPERRNAQNQGSGAHARPDSERDHTQTPPPEPERLEPPTIKITTSEADFNDAAVAALAGRAYPDLYQRSGELIRIIRHVELPRPEPATTRQKTARKKELRLSKGEPLIKPMGLATLRERLTGAAAFERFDKSAEEWLPAHPPTWAIPAIHARGAWPGIPPLYGIADYPLFRPDGTILDTMGYDDQTGYYLSATLQGLDIKPEPTRFDAESAVGQLLELVKDFPFVSETDQAAWLSFLLAMLARPTITGPCPLFVVEANLRGTGKTLLANIIGLILNGRDLPAQTYAASEEELEKILVSVARLGLPVICFDNVKLTIGGATVDKWLTSTAPTGRTLGSSELRRYDWRTVMCATSNNAAVSGDTDRRAIYIRLQTDHEQPELRTGFAVHDIRAHVLAHRAEYLGAALTILRAYAVAGRPAQQGRPKGSFEAWAAGARDPLMWAGLPDCERAPDDPGRPVDKDKQVLGPLLAAIHEAFGGSLVSVSDLLEEAWPPRSGSFSSEPVLTTHGKALRDALAPLAFKGDKPSRQMIGQRLHRYRGRWLNDMALECKRDSHTKANNWRVVTRCVAGIAGIGKSDSGSIPATQDTENKDVAVIAGIAGIDSNPDTCDRAGAGVRAGKFSRTGEIPAHTRIPAEKQGDIVF